ncbi:MAG: hypothetical protein SF052_18980 [Bacteroidia bacterium]|nr:hypothetical protein [Bacteroidia bacterium]
MASVKNILGKIVPFFSGKSGMIAGGVLILLWVIYAFIQVEPTISTPATAWMHVFSHKDFQAEGALWKYILELRTGIPPVISILEIATFNRRHGIGWILYDTYHISIVMMLVLPLFFLKRPWPGLIMIMAVGTVFLHSVILIHPSNPQLYDVLLPFLVLAYLLLSRVSFEKKTPQWLSYSTAFLAGFALSIAELSRPFVFLIFPFLIFYNLWHYGKSQKLKMLIFMIPVLLLSGLWHAKLFFYNDGQIIWSNHGGTNLYQVWSPFIDEVALKARLQPEAPPVNDFGWSWDNINTQIHYENSKARQSEIMKGIARRPGEAFLHLIDRILVFTRARTDMYANNPQAPVLDIYVVMVRVLYVLLGIMILYYGWKVIRSPQTLLAESFLVVLLTAFLTFLPAIGEAGEEARFLITVLPFLMSVLAIAIGDMRELLLLRSRE